MAQNVFIKKLIYFCPLELDSSEFRNFENVIFLKIFLVLNIFLTFL